MMLTQTNSLHELPHDNLSRQRGTRKSGRRDLMVAATALRHSATLVTGNTQHFSGISRLRLRDWRKR
ncbi:MAG: hypothetical protein HY318_17705 [Armatimonadetes bacterium]|nr:hypothetical protein [Armatimonadota bacterium]